MAAPKAFYSYMENEEKLNMLTDEQAGRLYKALYAYSRTGERPDMSDDPLLNYALADFLIDVDRDREKYEQTCKRRAEAGRKGGKANASNKEAKQANASFAKQKEAKGSKVSETEAETEAETDNIACAILNKPRSDFDNKANLVLQLFRTFCPSFVQPDKLTEYRKRLIYQAEQDGIDFEQLFKRAQSSKFLTNSKGIGIDWILTTKNTQKILEGNFDKEFKPPDRRKSKGSIYSSEGASFDIRKYENSSLFDD